ncbi:MAG: hypothetical protein WKG00_11865 [Polyangiaceae bacterium]
MAQRPPPYFVPSAGAPPGMQPNFLPSAAAVPGTLGAPMGRAPKAWETLSTVAIVLAAAQLLSFVYSMVTGLITITVGSLFGGMGPTGSSPLDTTVQDMRRFMQTMALVDMARGIPFAVCSVVLLVIALGIRRGRVESLRSARTWTWFALGVVAASLCLQLFISAPMMAGYQRRLFANMGAGAAPGSMGTFEVFASLSAIVMPVFWSMALCVWPIVHRVWADRLLRAMPDDPSGPATSQ